MKDATLLEFWLVEATNEELREFIETEPYSWETQRFLKYLIFNFEKSEEYERCKIVQDEIEYRSRIFSHHFDQINPKFMENKSKK